MRIDTFCDDVYRTLSTGQSILRSRDPEVLCNRSIGCVVVVDCCKNYKHGLSEIRDCLIKALYH